MKAIKKFIGDTLNLTYLKNLIKGEENKDLREFVAVIISVTLVWMFCYSLVQATDNSSRLYLCITAASFISALFGMEKFGKSNVDEDTKKK